MQEEEVWLPIAGHEKRHQVSNLGNVRVKDKKTGLFKHLKQWECRKGYMQVKLCDGDKQKRCTVHTLVAKAFIPNPHNKPQVNHKFGIKKDNRYTELEWCTQVENIDHAISFGLIAGKRRSRPKSPAKPSNKKVIDIVTGAEYASVVSLCQQLSINKKTLYKKLRGEKKNNTNFIYKTT